MGASVLLQRVLLVVFNGDKERRRDHRRSWQKLTETWQQQQKKEPVILDIGLWVLGCAPKNFKSPTPFPIQSLYWACSDRSEMEKFSGFPVLSVSRHHFFEMLSAPFDPFCFRPWRPSRHCCSAIGSSLSSCPIYRYRAVAGSTITLDVRLPRTHIQYSRSFLGIANQ